MLHCKKCGYQLPEGSVFCPSCGASIPPTEVKTFSDMHRNNFIIGAFLCLFPGILRLIDYSAYYVQVVLLHVPNYRTLISQIAQALSFLGPGGQIVLILMVDLIPPLIGIILILKAIRPSASVGETPQIIIKRPTRVTVVAILNLIIGFAYLMVGFFFVLWFPQAFKDPFWSSNAVGLARSLYIGVGILLFLQAYGYWNGKKWIFNYSIILLFGCLFIALSPLDEDDPQMPPIGDWLWFLQFLLLGLVYIIFSFYLDKPHVRAFFSRETIEELTAREKSEKERARAEGEKPIKALCEHLRLLGLEATMETAGLPNIAVRIMNRNIDLVELGYDFNQNAYRCNYVVQARVEGLEEKLKAEAEARPFKKGVLSRDTVYFQWRGKELAQILNSDTDLQSMLFLADKVALDNRGLIQLPNVEVKAYRKHQCIRISQKYFYKSPELAFPTAEAYEAYDRIAHAIRGVVRASSVKEEERPSTQS